MSRLCCVTLLFLFPISLSFGGEGKLIRLPEVKKDSHFSVEKAIAQRRSTRSYSSKPLTLSNIAALLWAGQGITSKEGLRAAPSAGALYPLELYLAAFHVESLSPGVYKYLPFEHALKPIKTSDIRRELWNAVLRQDWVRNGAAVIVIGAVFERTTKKYGERGKNYVYFEAGCVAENIHLMAERWGIGTVVIGAFFDDEVKKSVSMDQNEVPIALMPLGYK